MNNRGQSQIGLLLSLAIVLIVGVVLFQASAQNVGNTVNTVAVVNETLDTVVNGTTQYITWIRSITDVVVLNATDASGLFTDNGTVIGSGNFTVTNNVVNEGALAVSILPEATIGFKSAWRVSGTAQPTTYIDNSGGRALANIIILLFAVALAVIAIIPSAREKFMSR